MFRFQRRGLVLSIAVCWLCTGLPFGPCRKRVDLYYIIIIYYISFSHEQLIKTQTPVGCFI